jgi:hypothetical protein
MNSHDKHLIGGAESHYNEQCKRGERIEDLARGYLEDVRKGNVTDWIDLVEYEHLANVVGNIYPDLYKANAKLRATLISNDSMEQIVAITAAFSAITGAIHQIEEEARDAAQAYAEEEVDRIDWDEDEDDDNGFSDRRDAA